MKDKKLEKILKNEEIRQKESINLIASENIASKDVLEALGSSLTNKYAEGYPGVRYYAGNKNIDELEKLTQERALSLFKLNPKKWGVNVQALSGSPANLAVYSALLPIGGKIMGMELSSGGHLTHGHKASFTGKVWKQISYGLNEKEEIDFNELKKIAEKEKPEIIVCGFSSYSRKVNFKKFREVADSCGAFLMADISHIVGLIAGGEHESPFKYADVITTTTHKTLRGPRGALIFSKIDERKINEKIDKAIFPGLQGGPHMNTIAGIAVCLNEASQKSFEKYIVQVVRNAKAMSEEFKKLGWKVVFGGTENHIVMLDVFKTLGIGGDEASKKLENKNIIVNKNTIPKDTRGPNDPSGIRLGSPFETTKGKKEKDFIKIARKIDEILRK
jgi:glycine hydroxymethyltransferase